VIKPRVVKKKRLSNATATPLKGYGRKTVKSAVHQKGIFPSRNGGFATRPIKRVTGGPHNGF
jgi:hypothetical protein